MARGPAKDKAIALAPATAVHSNNDLDDLVRKRDAFVTSMTMLRNAAEEASRAGLAYFDHIIGASPNGDSHMYTAAYQRSMSAPPRAITEEPEAGAKRTRRKREKRDPDLPKRPMTAYLLFCNEGREAVKSDLGEGATHKDVIAELTTRWSKVPDHEKKAWQDMYQKNRAQYDKEIAIYKASKAPHPTTAPSTALATIPAPTATSVPAGGFTAVNHTEPAAESSPEPSPEPEASPEPAPAPAPAPAKAPSESELSEAEAEEEEEEEEEEERSPSPPPPPPKAKATPRGKKAAANGKKTPVQAPASPKEKRKRTSSRKKAAEEEAVVAEETPKKRAKKRRKSSGD